MIRYAQPRKGLFNLNTEEYHPKIGWVQKQEALVIIGETACSYTCRYLTSSIPYWDEYGRYEAHATTAVGVHKSRLVKWLPTQIQLF
ncbi:hypothetical protein [Limnovirga soli]|uniref:Uncharacterized protein n=1 Tax=Limnovirga soli TaxID=2656915 RepID=A0A8J8FDT0_9BACT|nr:hypothetical protein [Limnovirga soli]NNV54554.1 hypothetical protein [Limnovirga soli]